MAIETGFKHRLPDATRVRDRDTALLSFASGKRVLHLGCTDWPFTEEKLASGALLHQKLMKVSSWVGGVDIDGAGLKKLEDGLGGDYYEADVSGTSIQKLPDFDVIIAADVVEHVEDEAAFLKGLATLASKGSGASVVLSTPNSLALRNVVYTAFGLEVIHPDHRRIHSPRTLQAACINAGLTPRTWISYDISSGASLGRRSLDVVARAASRSRWAYGDGLILETTPVVAR